MRVALALALLALALLALLDPYERERLALLRAALLPRPPPLELAAAATTADGVVGAVAVTMGAIIIDGIIIIINGLIIIIGGMIGGIGVGDLGFGGTRTRTRRDSNSACLGLGISRSGIGSR